MRSWNAQVVAHAAGAQLLGPEPADREGPALATVDSRQAGTGALFVGLPGEHVHGGAFAAQALERGAWGVLTDPPHAEAVRAAGTGPRVILAAADPLRALQQLATAWRRQLAAQVIGVTGSTGKTSTKDLMHAVIAPHRRTVASRENFNTEIGLPLELLSAPADTEVVILEMGMRGAGQIAELAAIAEPDLGVIVSIGPVHLELLGTIENIAAAKAELIAGLAPGATAIVPAGERLLERHLRADLHTVTFGGPDGDVRLLREDGERLEIDANGTRVSLRVPFTQAHLRQNLLAAIAAARAIGVTPGGLVELELSPGRGQRRPLPGGVTLIEDCYNANPMSMRAALDDLAATAARMPAGAGEDRRPRRVAVLGDMLELGPQAERFHEEIGEHANLTADVLVAVGPLAAAIAERFSGESHRVADATAAIGTVSALLEPGDVVLVKASNGVGLRRVCEALAAGAPA